jgi:hypothetical protein
MELSMKGSGRVVDDADAAFVMDWDGQESPALRMDRD